MDTSFFKKPVNEFNQSFIFFDTSFLERWKLQEIEKGFYIRKIKYKVEEKQLETIFPFSGILDVLGHLVEMYPEEILFLDVETTGYYLNTSNLPFLIGIGYYKDSYFYLEQVLFLDVSQEFLQLEYFRNIIKNFKYIATYNGKKFDIPIIKSRFYYHSQKLDETFHHFDLYYFWKRLLPRKFEGGYSQKNLESRILKINREEDIDGSMVPQIYFDWKKYNQYDDFYKILLHNEWDVYHMFYLFLEALKLVKSKNQYKLELAKLFYRNHFFIDAIELLQELKVATLEEQLEAYKIFYLSYYRLQQWDKAVFYLQKRLELNFNPQEVLLLIRILQNKIKNYTKAIELINTLIEQIKNLPMAKKSHYLTVESLIKRRERISKFL